MLCCGLGRAEGAIGSLARGEAKPANAAVLSEMNGKRVAVQTGTISGDVAKRVLPDVELSYYNTQTDAMAALRAGKADAWATDEPAARYLLSENDDLRVADRLDTNELAAVFPRNEKGQALCRKFSAFVDELWANGGMDEIQNNWFGADESKWFVLDYEALPDINGTLIMAVDTTLLPFAYVKDNRVVGFDVDIAARFCAVNGYRLEVTSMNFDGVLPSVQTGK